MQAFWNRTCECQTPAGADGHAESPDCKPTWTWTLVCFMLLRHVHTLLRLSGWGTWKTSHSRFSETSHRQWLSRLAIARISNLSCQDWIAVSCVLRHDPEKARLHLPTEVELAEQGRATSHFATSDWDSSTSRSHFGVSLASATSALILQFRQCLHNTLEAAWHCLLGSSIGTVPLKALPSRNTLVCSGCATGIDGHPRMTQHCI